jgi:hypothetical protein
MTTIVDLGPEVAINTLRVRDPYVRLMLTAVGNSLAAGRE